MSMLQGKRIPLVLVGLTVLVLVAGCGGGQLSESDQDQASAPGEGLPADHPPVGTRLGSSSPTDDHELPLKLEGINSLEELQEALAQVEDDEIKAAFESGFRKTFTADGSKRDYNGAAQDLARVIERKPDFAAAYRALGYAKFNMGFNVDGALADYLKSVELEPDYGEAHYALAFMYAMTDREKGAVHYRRAMELGVPDERGLGERFYPGP